LRMVQLGFDVMQVADIGLVAYASSSAESDPLIHVWNGRDWIPITVEDYLGGTFLRTAPANLVLVGEPPVLPPRLAGSPVWAANTHQIPSLDKAEIINALGKFVDFSPADWNRLAAANGLTLRDQNAERRRYGRYGPPGTMPVRPAQAPRAAEMPPPAPVLPVPEAKGGEVKTEPPPVPVVKPSASVVEPPAVPEAKKPEASAPATNQPVTPLSPTGK
jgi:hypothetical protein